MIHHDDSQEILAKNGTNLEELQELNRQSALRSAQRAAAMASHDVPVLVAPKPPPKLDALQKLTSGGSILIELQPPPIQDILKVVHRLIDDGGFTPRAAEVKAIREALEEDSKLCAAIEAHGEDRLRKQRKEEVPHATGPLRNIDLIVHEARQYIRTLKTRRFDVRRKVAPVVLGMLERALIAADTVIVIIEQNEVGRCEDFGVPHEASNVLRACTVARRMIADVEKSARKSPDLVDVQLVAKLLDIRPEPTKPGTKLLGFIEV